MKKLFFVLILFSVSFFVFSEDLESSENIQIETKIEKTRPKLTKKFSIDLGYSLLAIKNNGFGLGITYEQYIWNHLAAKGTFGHSTFFIDQKLLPSVSFSLYALCYPFAKSLDGFYFGVGSALDFVSFPVPINLSGKKNSIFISVIPIIGYKFSIFKWLSADISVAYKFVLENNKIFDNDEYKKYISNGLLISPSLKFYLK